MEGNINPLIQCLVGLNFLLDFLFILFGNTKNFNEEFSFSVNYEYRNLPHIQIINFLHCSLT